MGLYFNSDDFSICKTVEFYHPTCNVPYNIQYIHFNIPYTYAIPLILYSHTSMSTQQTQIRLHSSKLVYMKSLMPTILLQCVWRSTFPLFLAENLLPLSRQQRSILTHIESMVERDGISEYMLTHPYIFIQNIFRCMDNIFVGF